MKKNEVKIGQAYQAKVSDRIVTVRIDSTNSHGGWNATNTATGKRIRIKSPQRLRRAVKPGKDVQAIAAADQENARTRDERAAAPDGMTASERAMSKSAGKKTKVTKADARRAVEAVVANDGPAAEVAATVAAVEAGNLADGVAIPTPAKKPRTRKPAAEPKPKRLSALDAAAQVLAGAAKPMRAKELIDAMAERGLWTSPGGKTPEATLYAAIIREIATKGDAARFRKVERGQFASAAAAVEA